MANLILPSRRVVQPQGPVEIDWTNPLARGLVDAISAPRLGSKSAVRGTYPTAVNSGAPVSVGSRGFGAYAPQSSGSSKLSYLTVAVGPPFTFILVYDQVELPNTTLRTAGDWGISSNGYVLAPNGTNFRALVSRAGTNTSLVGSPVLVGAKVDAICADTTAAAYWENGVRTAYNAAHGGIDASQGTLNLGAASDGAAASGARIYGAFVWNRALSDAEIRAVSENPWQLFRPIQRRVWVPGSALAQVYADRAGEYLIRGATTTDRAAAYNIRGAVSADASVAFNLRAMASADAAAAYLLRAAVSNDEVADYAIRAAAQQDVTGSYSVRASVSADASAAYSIQQEWSVSSDMAAGYAVRGSVTADSGATYAMRGSVQADAAASYSVRETVTANLGVGYTVDGALTAVYSDLGAAYVVEAATMVLTEADLQAIEDRLLPPILQARDAARTAVAVSV